MTAYLILISQALQMINIDSPHSPPFLPFITPFSIGLLDKILGFGRQEFPSSNCYKLCSISSTLFYPYSPFFYSRPANMGTRKRITRTQPANQVLIDKYRRNRKMQSCEPCRKLKVACDHSIPCGRCTRTRRVDKCYYHPNPLTRVSHECLLSTCHGKIFPLMD